MFFEHVCLFFIEFLEDLAGKVKMTHNEYEQPSRQGRVVVTDSENGLY